MQRCNITNQCHKCKLNIDCKGHPSNVDELRKALSDDDWCGLFQQMSQYDYIKTLDKEGILNLLSEVYRHGEDNYCSFDWGCGSKRNQYDEKWLESDYEDYE